MSSSPVNRVPSRPTHHPPSHWSCSRAGQPDHVSAASSSVTGNRPPEPGRPALPPGSRGTAGRTGRWPTQLRQGARSLPRVPKAFACPAWGQPASTWQPHAPRSWKALLSLCGCSRSLFGSRPSPAGDTWLRVFPTPMPDSRSLFLRTVFETTLTFKDNFYQVNIYLSTHGRTKCEVLKRRWKNCHARYIFTIIIP